MLGHSLKQLEYFLKVAECGNVSHAAAELNVSQPALSAAIAKLEDALGVQLFVRHAWKGLTPTAHGRWLTGAAQDVIDRARQLEQGVAELSDRLEGRLAIGCYTSFAPIHLPPLLASFREQYPDVTVEIHELRRADLLRVLDDTAVELALVYDMGLSDRIERTPLLEIPSKVLLPPDHPRVADDVVHLRDLRDDPFILLDMPGSREHLLAIFASLGLSPRIAMRAQSQELVRGLVASGFGYALLNSMPPHDLALSGGRTVAKPLADPVAPLSLVLASAKGAATTRFGALFSAHARAHFAALAGAASLQSAARPVSTNSMPAD